MKTTKRSMLVSGLCLLLTAVMLMGSTFAWFTDSVVNEGNKIETGKLDINVIGYRLEGQTWGSPVWENQLTSNPLITETNWEPGQYGAVLIRVSSYDCTVAAKVRMDFTADGDLAPALWYRLEAVQTTDASHQNAMLEKLQYKDSHPAIGDTGVTCMTEIGNDNTQEITLYPEYHDGQYAYYLLEYGMYTDVGSEYQNKTFRLDFTVKATQAPEEADGFGNTGYDAGATFPVSTVEDVRKAIANAQDGDVIALSGDMTVTDATVFTFAEAKALTLDLGGHTITYNNPSDKSALVDVSGGASLTLENGTITMDNPYYGLLVKEGSTLLLKDLNVTSGDSCVFSQGRNTKVVVEDCTLSSVYYAVYHNGSFAPADITIRNTEILSGGVYVSNSAGREKQQLTIENSTIYGPTAVEMKHTNAVITDSVLVGTSVPTGSGANNNGGCTEGYALAVTGNGVDDLGTGTVTVTNCKFYNGTAAGEPNGYTFVYKLAEGASVTIDGESVNDYNSYGG